MGQGHADLGEQVEIRVAVDLDILVVPIQQTRQFGRKLDAVGPADDDRMRVALDDLVHLARDRSLGVLQQRDAGRTARPVDALELLLSRQMRRAEAISERELIRAEDVDAEPAVARDQRVR